MKKMIKIWRSEEFWIVLLALIFLIFSYVPLVLDYLAIPPENRVFLGSYGYPPDFWGKMIIFREGRLGHWLFTHKTTVAIPTPAAIIPFEYIFLGQLSRLVPLDPLIFFHLCRLVLSLVFLLTSYLLISLVFDRKILRITAYLLTLFGTGFGASGARFIDNWSPLGIFQRGAYFPHYSLSFIFSLLVVILLSRALEEKNLKKLFQASVLGFLISFIHAPNTANLYLVLGLYSLLTIYLNCRQHHQINHWIYKIVYLGIYFLISVLPILYLRYLTQSYPWTLLMSGDAKFDFGKIFPKTFLISAVGPIMFLSFYGSWLAIKKKSDLALILAPWSITYIFGYLFAGKIFSFNSQRFLQTSFFVILAILSTMALNEISLKLAGKKSITHKIILIILTLIVLGTGFPAAKQSLKINTENFKWAGDSGYYTLRENLNAIRWLEKNTKENDIVLSDKFNGSLIAALAGNYPYANDETNLFPDDRLKQIDNTLRNFYQQTISNTEAKKFLVDNKIRYVFWSNLERNLAKGKTPNYPFLTKVFQSNQTIIFKVD